MKCQDCIHWTHSRSVESLPDYPIGFCEIFLKDVGGEFNGCAGKFFLSSDRDEWKGTIYEKEVPLQSPIDLPDGAKIVSITGRDGESGLVKITYLVPDSN